MLQHYKSSLIFTVCAMVLAFLLAGPQGALLAAILGVLETSLSLDNAVVNAKVLQDMDDKWRHRFLTWGMALAVFGVRLLFPILIVWGTSALSLTQSFLLPFENPAQYAQTVTAAHVSIAGFGGTFLMLVFLSFFMDQEKDEHWIPGVEQILQFIGKIGQHAAASAIILTLVIAGATTIFLHTGPEFFKAAAWGGLAWIAVKIFGELMDKSNVGAKAGLASFIYLEVLDSSFSFDGVVGAFAISNNIILIALGLGIGAMFVRSMTLHMVEVGTLGSLKFLEHGAFWSIGVLASMMYASTVVEIPEVVTGLSAALILGISVVHSLLSKKEADAAHA